MTPREHEDGMRREPGLSAAEKTDGFAAVMRRLNSRTPQERARLELEAEEVRLGHEAYALGHEYLDRGDFDAARRWLGVAAGYRVPGAEQALEEIALHLMCDGLADSAVSGADPAATDSESCGSLPRPLRAPGSTGWVKNIQAWTWDPGGMPDLPSEVAARLQAEQITDRARREADAILAAARQEAGQVGEMVRAARRQADAIRAAAREDAEATAAACAEKVLDVDKDRAEAAQLLSEARQLAEEVRSQVAKIEAATRARARRQDGSSSGAERRSAARRYEVVESLRVCARSVHALSVMTLSDRRGMGKPSQKVSRPDAQFALVSEFLDTLWAYARAWSEEGVLAATDRAAALTTGEDVLAAYVQAHSSAVQRTGRWKPAPPSAGKVRGVVAPLPWSPDGSSDVPGSSLWNAGGEWVGEAVRLHCTAVRGEVLNGVALALVNVFDDMTGWYTRSLDSSRHALNWLGCSAVHDLRGILGEFGSHEPAGLRLVWLDCADAAGALSADWLGWIARFTERVERLADGPRMLEQAPDEQEEDTDEDTDEDSAATSAGSSRA
ncbi:hypothetical protein ABZW47_31195 [Streptomyces sp. NPDC004549]|uniref:hypothetical protein n=1 Tax=Streptomyces sp. NPDC004549 TaxID=3154283 RepID=UPI0033B0DF88